MRFRSLAIICPVAVVGILLVLCSHSFSEARRAVASFVGVTNSGTSTYAVFYFTKGARDVSYQIRALEKRSENGWIQVPLDSSVSRAGDARASGSFPLWLPVASTNAEYRIRVSCTERAPGLLGLRDKALEICHGFRRNGGNTTIYRGRNYDVTSEQPTAYGRIDRMMIVEPNGAANRSQPFRSGTNLTSVAAGSSR